MLNIYQYISIPLGYLLGSIPAAFIIGKLIGKFDLRTEESDGKISAAAIYRRLKLIPFLLVVIIDVGKGLASILLASFLSDHSWIIILLTGFATVMGHNWSIFLKFKGGLGATVTWGVLGGVALYQLLIAFIPTLIYIIITKKSGISTAVGIISLSIVLLIQKILAVQNIIPWDIPVYLIVFPGLLIMFMVIKQHQVNRKKNRTCKVDDNLSKS